MTYTERLLRVIPGGAHTYSRGFDQFPFNAPEILKSGHHGKIEAWRNEAALKCTLQKRPDLLKKPRP